MMRNGWATLAFWIINESGAFSDRADEILRAHGGLTMN
jgi:hypothetical protein